jgi:very-short-patch-repair endonuclease
MRIKINLENFIERCNIIHNNKYDYNNTIYINNKTNIKIICNEHGEFNQLPINHLSGSGCSKCYFSKKRITDFIDRVKIVHNNKYSYELVNYKNNITRVKIICNEHGIFEQQPKHHLNGHGCPDCGGTKKLNNEKFIENSKEVHKKVYDYSLVKYIDNQTKVNIICNKHGIFEQRPDDHMRGRGCIKCGDKFGIKENKWLDSLNVKDRQVRIDKYIVDGYDSTTNTIYEFNGDYWHGNPKKYKKDDVNSSCKKTFGELYNNTIEKEKILIDKGYRVISIWESEYINKNKNLTCH